MTIGRGVWELCEGQNYSGRCVTLDQSVPDLAAYKTAQSRPFITPGRIRWIAAMQHEAAQAIEKALAG